MRTYKSSSSSPSPLKKRNHHHHHFRLSFCHHQWRSERSPSYTSFLLAMPWPWATGHGHAMPWPIDGNGHGNAMPWPQTIAIAWPVPLNWPYGHCHILAVSVATEGTNLFHAKASKTCHQQELKSYQDASEKLLDFSTKKRAFLKALVNTDNRLANPKPKAKPKAKTKKAED